MSKILFTVLRSSIRRTLSNDVTKSNGCSTQLRGLCISTTFSTKPESTSKTPSQKKSKEIPKVTLIQQNQAISVTSLEEAQKLARRRDLQLVKVQDLDSKSQRPVYRLATAAEILADDFDGSGSKPRKSSTATKKSEKSLTIGSRISDNDLASRLKNINKWLSKGTEVRIVIQGTNDNDKNAETILEKIEASIKEPEVIGKIVQKRVKDNFIKFVIVPVAVAKKEA